ncbi:MAG: molybdenum cofactor guanylyltransferase [Chloroflexi bacterium]|nr:molybdenum cofactor guanylyltransferase [Chloroflexota bacterium]
MKQTTIAIMAGGKSSRMGSDKSFIPFQGRPMIEIVRERVAGLAAETILITNKPDEYAHLNLPMFGDVYPDKGPLGGIYTAVHHATHPHTLVVACDMPWLNRDLLVYMITQQETADIVIPRPQKFPEPLHAIYSKVCLAPIEANIKADRLKITGFFGKVSVNYLGQDVIGKFDGDGRSFANINTPTDLEENK